MRGLLRKTPKTRELHGLTGTSEQRIWAAMIQRCTNPKHPAYSDYGGRGIKVCLSWFESIAAFVKDMGRRPGKGYSLGRIDNDGAYEPSNCHWETALQQSHNRRNTVRLYHEGNIIILADLPSVARSRRNRGWPTANIMSGIPPQTTPLERLRQKPAFVKQFCAKKRKEGLKLRQIGELLGVTRQRVHQILGNSTIDSKTMWRKWKPPK